MNTAIKSPAKIGFVLLAAGLLLAVPCARAQTGVTKSDVKFMQEAAQGGLTEVKLGELAAKKGMSDSVKEFGEKMVKDHGAMNAGLNTLAAQKNVTLPTSLDEKHQAMVNKMAALPGSEFDDTYVIDMVKDHENDVKAFKDELATTQDADIQSFVAKSLPVVQAHLKQVAGMQKAPVSPVNDMKN